MPAEHASSCGGGRGSSRCRRDRADSSAAVAACRHGRRRLGRHPRRHHARRLSPLCRQCRRQLRAGNELGDVPVVYVCSRGT